MNAFARYTSAVGVSVCVLMLASCNADPSGTTESQLRMLEAKVATLESQVATLQKSAADDKRQQQWDKLLASADKFGYLTPGSDGYSAVRYDLGTVTVQLADVQPYANGSRVILRFGNTLAATVNGLKLTIDWGAVTNEGPDNEHQKSKEITFNEQLRSGAWTSVPVVLEGVPPTELGFVRVHDITHTGIVLFGR